MKRNELALDQADVKIANFQSLSDSYKLRGVLEAYDSLIAFVDTNPTLTRFQWNLLDNAIGELKALLVE